mmetsp:Transcript_3439/g.8248  ORF Transcript_3439/g.8248 Transcript_3439/m.8248 type:complete len:213 (+) Transcript_3439:296-934(+)
MWKVLGSGACAVDVEPRERGRSRERLRDSSASPPERDPAAAAAEGENSDETFSVLRCRTWACGEEDVLTCRAVEATWAEVAAAEEEAEEEEEEECCSGSVRMVLELKVRHEVRCWRCSASSASCRLCRLRCSPGTCCTPQSGSSERMLISCSRRSSGRYCSASSQSSGDEHTSHRQWSCSEGRSARSSSGLFSAEAGGCAPREKGRERESAG